MKGRTQDRSYNHQQYMQHYAGCSHIQQELLQALAVLHIARSPEELCTYLAQIPRAKCATLGLKIIRPLLNELEEGSLLILSELSRLGRTSLTMQVELDKLIKKGVNVKTLDKRLDTTSMSKEIVGLIVSIMGYCAEQELSQIKSRTSEGRAVALSRGVKFGRKKSYDQFQVAEVMKKKSEGQGLGTIAKSLGMSRSMVQRIVKEELVVA